jgi:hypothetical protein
LFRHLNFLADLLGARSVPRDIPARIDQHEVDQPLAGRSLVEVEFICGRRATLPQFGLQGFRLLLRDRGLLALFVQLLQHLLQARLLRRELLEDGLRILARCRRFVLWRTRQHEIRPVLQAASVDRDVKPAAKVVAIL